MLNKLKKHIKQKIVNIYNESDSKKRKDMNSRYITFFPYQQNSDSYLITSKKENLELCEQGLPVPPKNLRMGYGKDTEEYLQSGRQQIETMTDIIGKSGADIKKFEKILDIGCSSGRMIRWLNRYSSKAEIWGSDISSEHIMWANKYLNPPFNFVTTTTVPHLPFEDRSFELVYACSVFTHIDDLSVAWLLELKRIIKTGGLLYLTIHDKHSLEMMNSIPVWKESWLNKFINGNNLFVNSNREFDVFVGLRGTDSQVFYDLDYFCNSVRKIFEIVSVNKGAYGYQTGILLKRAS